MKIENKNLLYSLTLAALLVIFLLGYFIWMLPSLYVRHMEEENLDGVIRQHKAYLEQGDYEGVQLMNPAACFTLELPKKGDSMLLTTGYVSARLTAKSEGMKALLSGIADAFTKGGDAFDEPSFEQQFGTVMDELGGSGQLPAQIEILERKDGGGKFVNEHSTFHRISDEIVVMETSVEDSVNRYESYFAITERDASYVVSFLAAMTPDMDGIRPVVLGSVPMIGMVIVLLVLIFSYLYSRGIIRPLFRELERKNRELDVKNRELSEENERQEFFLRASSHQLKTPISAALLLTDGMISQVGKFKDYGKYLPRVKKELLSMRRIVEDILELNHSKGHVEKRQVDAAALLRQLAKAYEIKCQQRGLRIRFADAEGGKITEVDAAGKGGKITGEDVAGKGGKITGEDVAGKGQKITEEDAATETAMTTIADMENGELAKPGACIVGVDPRMLEKVLDNLLSNAVLYADQNSELYLSAKSGGIVIENAGQIDPRIEEHLFEPFVSGNYKSRSHGLGLYIAGYYARLLGMTVTVKSIGGRVVSSVEW